MGDPLKRFGVQRFYHQMKLMICCVLLPILFHMGQSTNRSTQPFRTISIQKKENGYRNFESVAFTFQRDLDSFLKETSTQIGWNNRQEFEAALRNAKVDFTEEALVLLRHTEGSGSVQVTFETPVLEDRKLLCKIRGRPIPPGHGGTTDMAYYCLAVAVSKSAVSQVEFQAVEGGFFERRPPIVFQLSEKQPSNKRLQRPRG
jgi:hypothetical protein